MKRPASANVHNVHRAFAQSEAIQNPVCANRSRILVRTPYHPFMRYLMKQKLFSFGDDFHIRDENGRDIYFVDGKVFSIGDKLSFKDMRGDELAFIRQKLLALRPSYEIYRQGRLYATVKKELFTFLRCRFYVDIPGPDDLEATGNLLEHEYTFRRHGREVANISKKWFSMTDSYGVDIADGEDDVLILASTVVIDMACHQDQSK